jgi:hypothetical protein
MLTVGILALLEESYVKGYFQTKTIFTLSLFKISSLFLTLVAILLFSAPSFWSCNHSYVFSIFPIHSRWHA